MVELKESAGKYSAEVFFDRVTTAYDPSENDFVRISNNKERTGITYRARVYKGSTQLQTADGADYLTALTAKMCIRDSCGPAGLRLRQGLEE